MNHSAAWFRLLLIPIVLFLAILTLPIYETFLLPGIDPPLQWVFDHFYSNGFEDARHLHFPHGPLAFFMYPLSNSLSLVVTITLMLKLFVAHLFIYLHKEKDWKEWVLTFILIYVVFIAAQFNQLLIVAVLLSYHSHFRSKQWIYLFLGITLTAFSIYVKSYVGIITGITSATYFIYQGVSEKSIAKTILSGVYLVILYLSFWLFIFNSPEGFLDYFTGIIQLAGDNSSAASYYPWNNWWLLSLFILLAGLIPWINRKTENRMIAILILPMLFAGWKHGMAREDLSHYHGLIILLVLVLVVLVAGSKQKRMLNLLAAVGCIVLLNYNGEHLDNYRKPTFQTASIARALQFWEEQPQDQIDHHRLSRESLELIGEKTVDVYPWDYSIIATNELNWQPRPVLHSYASYTKWLDGENNTHFNSDDAPEFIIWELEKITSDLNGGNLESIDNRYLLNNEPLTLITLLKRYKGIRKEGGLLILQKRQKDLTYTTKNSLELEQKMGDWINLPSHGHNSVLRLKPKLEKSTLQGIKSFLYKDEQYWLLLKTSSGSIFKYRIVPKIAEEGLWINPLLVRHDAEDLVVTEVSIISSNQKIVPASFSYQWEEFIFNEEAVVDQFFAREANYFKTWPFYTYLQDYREHDEHWSVPTKITPKQREFVNEYSSTLSVALDSVPFKRIGVRATLEVWSETDPLNEVQLVLRVEGGRKTYSSAEHIKFQMLNPNDKNVIVSSLTVDSLETGSTLSAFIFNPRRLPLEIDNFKVELLHP